MTFFLSILRLVPLKVWLGIAVACAAVAGVLLFAHQQREIGRNEVRAEWALDRAQREAVMAKLKVELAQKSETVRVQYVDRVKVIHEKGEEVIREVEKLVPAGCDLPGGFRVLHDAAASGDMPADPLGVAAAADPVEAPAAALTVIENYTACRADQARLAALQQLLKGVAP